jgi:hypothetical protein
VVCWDIRAPHFLATDKVPFGRLELFSATMDVERIFSAEQIVVHPELAKIIREYTKAVIRKAPFGTDEIVNFSAEYFKKKVDEDNALRLAALGAGDDA